MFYILIVMGVQIYVFYDLNTDIVIAPGNPSE